MSTPAEYSFTPDPEPHADSAVAQRFSEGTLMIVAFAGWNDAGSASTNALQHFSDAFEGRLHDELDPEPYVDFQVNRPTIVRTEAGNHILWPSTRVETISQPHLPRDFVLVHGVEPSMRWRTYYQSLLRIADQLDCSGIVLLGSMVSEISHLAKNQVTATSSNVFLQEFYGLEESTYEGPTGINGVLSHYAELDGIPTVSLWAEVPNYAPNPPSIRAEVSLLQALEDLTQIAIPLGELADELHAWELGVSAFVDSDPELAQYVAQLEEPPSLEEVSGDSIAQEFERFLRRRGNLSTINQQDPPHAETQREQGTPKSPETSGTRNSPGTSDQPQSAESPHQPHSAESADPSESADSPDEPNVPDEPGSPDLPGSPA